MLKKCGLTVALAALVLSMVATALPAQAKGPLTGAAAINCKANLNPWPSQPTIQGGTCPGQVLLGALAGVDNANTPFAGVAALVPFNAKFNYSEICPVKANDVFPVAGFADGVATIGPFPVVHGLNPNALGVLTAPFTWVRVGTFAVIRIGKLDTVPNKFTGPNKVIVFSDGGVANDAVGGAAIAAFVPDLVPGDCGTPAPTTATVVALDIEIA